LRDTKHFRLDDPWFFESELVELRGRLEQVKASITSAEGGAGSISVDSARIIPPWEKESARSMILMEWISATLVVIAAAMVSCGLILFFAALFGSRSQLWSYSLPALCIGFATLSAWGLMQLFIRRAQILPMVEIERLRQLHCPEAEDFDPPDFSQSGAN